MTLLTLTEIAALIGARLEGDGSRQVSGPASLEDATRDEVSFLAEARLAARLETTAAAAVVVVDGVARKRDDLALLHCDDPQQAFNRIVEAFAPGRTAPTPGVHPTVVLGDGVEIDPSASIGPYCVLGPGASIAAGVVLHPQVTLGEGCVIGAGSVLHPGVVLYAHVTMGAGCIVHAGSVIGADGFGFEPTRAGWIKTPQGGTVIIEDEVEIGANVTIDCARFKATRICRGVKIDNLVHVAHNCHVGEGAMLIAQSGVAGSTRIGARAILAGKAGVSGHLVIGDGARIGGAAAVFRDVPAGEDWWGVPAVPKAQAIRQWKNQDRIQRLKRALRSIEERVERLEGRQ